MRNKLYRRHQRVRMKNHARDIIKNSWGIDDIEKLEMYVSQNADNMQVCSCPGCSSNRNNEWAPLKERLTMSERRMEESLAGNTDVS